MESDAVINEGFLQTENEQIRSQMDESFSNLQRKQLNRNLTDVTKSATQIYWKTNLVPSNIVLEDGFYDPGRAESSIDWEVVDTAPPLASFFGRDASG
jgi:hypothetical protein